MTGQDDRAKIRFGSFELDTQSGELRRRGVKLKLAHQAYRVLRVLLDAPGQIVTRDCLKRSVWPEQKSADFDSGINKSVSQIRAILGDSGGTHDSSRHSQNAATVLLRRLPEAQRPNVHESVRLLSFHSKTSPAIRPWLISPMALQRR